MKRLIVPLVFLISLTSFSQELYDEFMPTFIGDKEAFLSSKSGEFVYREHAKTDVSALYTSDSGTVIYEDRKTHSVKKGETLSSIAKKHSVSIVELKAQNKLKSTNLNIGQELKIVLKHVVPSSKPIVNKPEGTIIARLAPGQTPGGMTPPDLPPDALPGSTINLVVERDTTKDVVQIKVEAETENLENKTVHIVKSGESLFSIAKKFKMSIKDLKELNNLALNTITPGQKLKISIYNPAVFLQNETPNNTILLEAAVEEQSQVPGAIKNKVEHAQKKIEETAASTGSVEKSSQEEVVDVTVEKDAKEKLAKKKDAETAREERTKALIKKYKKKEVTEEHESDKPSIYVVKKGDTLWSIAKRLHISIKDLKELNNLDTNDLSIGQELKVN